MSFEPRKTDISKQVAVMDDRELLGLFEEIYDYNETGVLHGDKLRSLSMQRFKAYDMVRVYEEKILFEMARRYANMLSSRGQDTKEDYSNIEQGDIVYYADPETGSAVEKGIVSSVNYQPECASRPKKLFVDFRDDQCFYIHEFEGAALGVHLFLVENHAERVAIGLDPYETEQDSEWVRGKYGGEDVRWTM